MTKDDMIIKALDDLKADIKYLRDEINLLKINQARPMSAKAVTAVISGITATATIISTTLISIFGK